MKKTFVALMMLFVVLAVTGCGGGGSSSPPLIVKTILSDATVDGDVRLDFVTGSLTVTQVTRDAVPSVLAGVRPSTLDEYRAFLDFPLATIPTNAIIDSATLDIVINSVVSASGSVPIRVELVSFAPPLLGSDFDRVLLPPQTPAPVLFTITSADVNRHVLVDVTSLMTAAQGKGLPAFQIRILEDFGFVLPGLIEIDDTASATAPLLKVVFF